MAPFEDRLTEALADVQPAELRYATMEHFAKLRESVSMEMVLDGCTNDDQRWFDNALLRLARNVPSAPLES